MRIADGSLLMNLPQIAGIHVCKPSVGSSAQVVTWPSRRAGPAQWAMAITSGAEPLPRGV
jgi:hypothetical protein